MVSIPTVLEKLTAIEQSIGQRDLRDVEHELLELLEASEGADPHISDRILNIQLQILIGENRFEELSQAVDVERDVAHADAAVRMLIGKGILANRNGDYRNSLIHFLEAESKALINGNKSLIAQVQVNIGTVYAALHHYKDGLDRYDHVLKKYKKEISNSTQAALLHNLGNLYYTIGDIEESIACFQASINLNNTSTIERSKILLNRSYIAQGKGAVAETAAISKEHDLYPVYLFCSSFGNSAIAQLGRLKEAAKTAQSRNDYTTALAALKHIINIYKTEGAYKEVCEYLEKYASIERSLIDKQQVSKLAEQAARYEILEKEKSIKALLKETALKEEIVKRNDMLEVANEDLRQFAYVVSHDLKEPLRMIGSYTQLIESSLYSKISEADQEFFGFVKGGVERLNVLLDGLSNYSTLKSLNQDKDIYDLNEIVKTSLENIDVLIKETQSKVGLNNLSKIKGSKTLLVLLFQNLIQNAIKFRSKNVIPEIKVSSVEHENKTIVSVSDNGIGIPEKQHERVFIIFQRLSRDLAKGSGMGLAICKKIVQLHEGRIYIKKEGGRQGTTFIIELPN